MYYNGDTLHSQNFDHPERLLVTVSVTGINYNSLNISFKISLGAKSMLGFIKGVYLKPNKKI